jgi:hypothetical protein
MRVMSIASVNPATGETLRSFDPLTAPEIEARMQRVDDAFRAPVDVVHGSRGPDEARGRDPGVR